MPRDELGVAPSPLNGGRPGQHLVQDAGQAVLVAARIDFVAAGLLGAHVGRGAQRGAGHGEPIATGGVRGARAMPKSATIAWPSRSSTFSGLTSRWITPRAMRVVQRLGHLSGKPERVGDRELAFAVEPLPQRFALDVGHDVEGPRRRVRGLARVDQSDDVGMLELRRDGDLARKPLAAERGGDLLMHDLDRHVAVVLLVPGQEDRRHPASAELAFEAVAGAKQSH